MANDKKSADNSGAPLDEKEAKKAQREAEKAADKAKKERIKQSKPKKEGNIFTRIGGKIAQFWKDFKGTAKKITWPSGKTVLKNTGIVLLSILIFGAGVWIVDFLLSQGVSKSTSIIEGLKDKEELSEAVDEDASGAAIDTEELGNDELVTIAEDLTGDAD